MKSTKKESGKIAPSKGTCCETSTNKETNSKVCCLPPSDGSSCCDKTESKEENAKKSGCC